jgi:hypothetical protein
MRQYHGNTLIESKQLFHFGIAHNKINRAKSLIKLALGISGSDNKKSILAERILQQRK